MFDLKALDGTPWLVEPVRFKQMLAMARTRVCPPEKTIRKAAENRLKAARALRAVKGKVGVIPVRGMIDQRMGEMLWMFGGTSCEEIGAALDALLSDASIDGIVMHIDSPGGTSYGVEELSDKIYAGRAKKPIYGIADSGAGSAAYWILSATANVSMTPGGDVGSVGVYTMHVDVSKALEQEGVQVTFVSAGKYKVELAPTSPLSADARDYLQTSVDATYSKFTSAVARNRGTTVSAVREKYGQGRMMNADQALSAGAVDAVRTFEELLGRLAGNVASAKSMSADMARVRAAQRARLTENLLDVPASTR